MLRVWRSNCSNYSSQLLIALTVLLDFTAFGLIFPLLPFWAERLGANAFAIGLLMTVHALALCIFTPILGTLSDRLGRRPIIIASLLIEVASLAITALTHTLPLLFLARFIGGIGASSISAAQTVVVDVTPPERRAKGIGMLGAAFGIGMIVGPTLGSILSSLKTVLPFWVAMGIVLLNALLVTLFLPETRKKSSAMLKTGVPRRWNMFPASWQRVYRSRAIMRLIVINLLFALAFATVTAIFALFTEHHFGWKARQVGYTFTYLGVITIIMQGGLIGWLVKRLGEQKLLLLGLLCLAGGLVALSFSRSVALVLLSLGVLHIGEGAVRPAITALLSFASPADAEGETLGIAQGVSSLGMMIGPMLAGGSYLLAGSRIPFLGSGVLALIAMLLALPALPILVHQGIAPLTRN